MQLGQGHAVAYLLAHSTMGMRARRSGSVKESEGEAVALAAGYAVCSLLAKGQRIEARCVKQRLAAPSKGWMQRLAAVDASGGASAMADAALTGIGTTTRPSLRFMPPAPHTSSGMFCVNAA